MQSSTKLVFHTMLNNSLRCCEVTNVYVLNYLTTCMSHSLFRPVLYSSSLSRDSTDSSQTLSKKEREYYTERQELAVQFIYCMTLTEILQQVS